MAFGSGTISSAAGAVGDILGGQTTAKGLRIKAEGERVEAANYTDAAAFARDNIEFTRQSVAVKQLQADRAYMLGIGATEASVAGAGFAQSGSALDILRESAAESGLTQQVLTQQGVITEAGFEQQAKAYERLASYAMWSAGREEELADNAERNSYITGVIKAGAAVASIFF